MDRMWQYGLIDDKSKILSPIYHDKKNFWNTLLISSIKQSVRKQIYNDQPSIPDAPVDTASNLFNNENPFSGDGGDVLKRGSVLFSIKQYYSCWKSKAWKILLSV